MVTKPSGEVRMESAPTMFWAPVDSPVSSRTDQELSAKEEYRMRPLPLLAVCFWFVHWNDGAPRAARAESDSAKALCVALGARGLLAKPAEFAKQVNLLYISMGSKEGAGTGRSIHEQLDQAGVQHVYFEAPGTAHEFQTWRKSLFGFAPLLFQKKDGGAR